MDIETRSKIKEIIIEEMKKGISQQSFRQIIIGQDKLREKGIDCGKAEEIYCIGWEIFHELYRNGVVDFEASGSVVDYNNIYSPRLRVTNYGQEVLKEEGLPVYDPDGYIRVIKEEVPDIDPIILEYLKESITTFNRGCPMSAVISLGIASEKMVLLLYEALGNALGDSERKELDNVRNNIFSKHKKMEELLEKKKKKMPEDIKNNYDVYLNAMFHLMRIHRNELGHPTGASVEKSVIQVFLKSFGIYLKWLYQLKEFLDKSEGTL
jgi:hypothetical protein